MVIKFLCGEVRMELHYQHTYHCYHLSLTQWPFNDFTDGPDALNVRGGSKGQQREGAVQTPYMGTPPTLHCYWLRALCSCLSTRWPSSSCRLTLIILVSPRTYRKSWCHFKIDSGRAAAWSPNKAHGQPDCVWTTDRHTRLEYPAIIRQGW